jgi:iron complex outermembrane recepter protein
LEQVLVTWQESSTETLLGAQTIEFTRADIDLSGLATAEDFLHTLPQVFGGGANETTVLGREAATNSERGSGVNIRGLDAGATLILIDGMRVAPSGTSGAFQDVSNIPLSIVDHIDILPDAVSAQYGADAVGGVVNFVTRTGSAGIQTLARGGGVTDGSMSEQQFSQLFGVTGDSSNGLLSFEYYHRGALLAQDRSQETSNLTPFGGSNFDLPFGNPGNVVGPAGYYPIPKVQNGTPLTAASLIPGAPNLYDQDQGSAITPDQKRWSFFGNGNAQLNDDIALHLEGLFTRRSIEEVNASNPLSVSVPTSNPFYLNPTGVPGPVQADLGSATYLGLPETDNRIDTGNLSLGFSTSEWHGWSASGFVGYSFEKQHFVEHGLVNETALTAALADPNPATAFNPFGDASANNPATLAGIDSYLLSDTVSSVKTLNLGATGPALTLPGGDTHLMVGSEYRIQSFGVNSFSPGNSTDNSDSSLSRTITAEFAELRIPIFGANNRLPFARRLEISLGGRHENYSDVGSVTVPKLGMLWSPSDQINIRSTFGKSFRPPDPTDLSQKASYSQLLTLADPLSPTRSSSVLALFGTNPNLRPEGARTWTLGTDFTPTNIPGLSFSVNYFNIIYSGRIDVAEFGFDVLSQPADAWLVNRNVTPAQLQAACSQTVFIQSSGTCQSSSVTAILDDRLRNIALLKTNGLDLLGKYALDTSIGKFEFGLNGTYLFEYSQANTPDAPLVNIVSTQNNPINLRFRGSASWARRGFAVSSAVNFANSYRDTISVPNRDVAAWTTLDLQLRYDTEGDSPAWLEQTRFSLNAQNVFNTPAPFLNNSVGVGYDQENANLVGRLVSFEISKRW